MELRTKKRQEEEDERTRGREGFCPPKQQQQTSNSSSNTAKQNRAEGEAVDSEANCACAIFFFSVFRSFPRSSCKKMQVGRFVCLAIGCSPEVNRLLNTRLNTYGLIRRLGGM